MENIKLNVLTQAQYQFLVSKEVDGYYDDRTREQLYSLIDKLWAHKQAWSKEEARLHKRFQGVEFGILFPGQRKTTGPLKFKVSLCINGDHEGDIITGGTLIVGEHGCVQGNVSAEEIICKGQITGDVKAGTQLTLSSSGSLLGNVVAPAVQIAPGAVFKGKCKLGSDRPKPVQPPVEKMPIKNRISQLFGAG